MRGGAEYGPRESDWKDDTKGAIEPDQVLYDGLLIAEEDYDAPVLQGNIFDGTATSGSIPFVRELHGDPLDETEVVAKVSRMEWGFGQNRFGH